MSTEVKFPVGSYCMHRMHGKGAGTLVRIDSEKDGGQRGRVVSVEYVQVTDNGVTSGGSSGAWEESQLAPITDPELLAAARCYEAMRKTQEHQVLSNLAQAEARVWQKAVVAIREAKAAVLQQAQP